ncbi:hypothetical protein AAV98_09250 [Bacillus sp. CHD6a]|nr:hypothetical protein AAV98_09250 [Bacillus sp. CHD6a]
MRAFHFIQQGDSLKLRLKKPQKNIILLFFLFLAVYWSKWRRLLRGSSGNVETPQRSEEAQGRPVESAAICGKEQRLS